MIEFERRFLINPGYFDLIRNASHHNELMTQGYVCADSQSVVRLRSIELPSGNVEWVITVKQDTGQLGKNFEYESIVEDATELFNTLPKRITKRRYAVWHLDQIDIEVDVFQNECAGLIIAEVELESDEQSEWLTANLPIWFGKEITGQKQYSNYSLCMNGLPND